MDEFTEEEFLTQKQRIEHHYRKATTQDSPSAYLIVGQPGAGKTRMANIFSEAHNGNIAFINGDEYRKYHPHYRELVNTYGDDAVLHTAKFSGRMTEALIDDFSSDRYHLIIEGTLRTTEVPLKTKKLLESRGYAVSLNVILVRPEVSYLSTLKRYEEMKKLPGMVPRRTPKEHHDKVVRSIIDNLSGLYLMDAFQEIRVFDRDEQCLYDSETQPNENPAHLFETEFSRPLSDAEQSQIRASYGSYLSPSDLKQVFTDYAQMFRLQNASERLI